MNRTRLLVFAALLAAGSAFAQTAPTNDGLHQQLGGQPALVRLMGDFVPRLIADRRMNPSSRTSTGRT